MRYPSGDDVNNKCRGHAQLATAIYPSAVATKSRASHASKIQDFRQARESERDQEFALSERYDRTAGGSTPCRLTPRHIVQRGVRGRAGVIGIETRPRLFGPKSRASGVDAVLVPHHVGFRGLQIAHASQSAVDPVARKPQARLVPCP